MNKEIILLTRGKHKEVWGSLAEICRVKGFYYQTLVVKKFPFEYRGIKFARLPFREENGVKPGESRRKIRKQTLPETELKNEPSSYP